MCRMSRAFPYIGDSLVIDLSHVITFMPVSKPPSSRKSQTYQHSPDNKYLHSSHVGPGTPVSSKLQINASSYCKRELLRMHSHTLEATSEGGPHTKAELREMAYLRYAKSARRFLFLYWSQVLPTTVAMVMKKIIAL